jgi:hypothetical protein
MREAATSIGAPHSHNDLDHDNAVDSNNTPMALSLSLISPRNVVRAIFLLLGIGVLIPWNSFISAKGYFQSRFCDPSMGKEENVTMESTFALVYNLSSVISMGMVIFGRWLHGQRTRSEDVLEELYEEDTNLVVEVDRIYSQDALADHTTRDSNSEIEASRREPVLQQTISYSSVNLPLSVFLAVFIGQMWMVSVPLISPRSMQFCTLLGISVCGICSAMATAGIVAAAGRFRQADEAMNPFLAVRLKHSQPWQIVFFSSSLYSPFGLKKSSARFDACNRDNRSGVFSFRWQTSSRHAHRTQETTGSNTASAIAPPVRDGL